MATALSRPVSQPRLDSRSRAATSQGTSRGTLLILASEQGDVKTVKSLISRSADLLAVAQSGDVGVTGLSLAAARGHAAAMN